MPRGAIQRFKMLERCTRVFNSNFRTAPYSVINSEYDIKVSLLLISFQLNGGVLGFHGLTWKLERLYKAA